MDDWPGLLLLSLRIIRVRIYINNLSWVREPAGGSKIPSLLSLLLLADSQDKSSIGLVTPQALATVFLRSSIRPFGRKAGRQPSGQGEESFSSFFGIGFLPWVRKQMKGWKTDPKEFLCHSEGIFPTISTEATPGDSLLLGSNVHVFGFILARITFVDFKRVKTFYEEHQFFETIISGIKVGLLF